MKHMKRTVALTILIALLTCLLCPAFAQAPNAEAVYAPVLSSAADLLSCEIVDEHIPAPGETAIQEIRMASEREDAPWNVGYCLQDLSGDGISELIIAEIKSQEVKISHGDRILAIYTCAGNQPRLVLEGWGRNRYYLLPDGTLLNEGSSGAANSCLGLFRLTQDGTQTECLDLYFTEPEGSEIVTYYNTLGIWDPAYEGNQRLDLDLWQLDEIMRKDIQLLELTAFAFYLEEDHPSLLLAQWNPYAEIENCVILSSSEYSAQIVLYAYHGAVTDLQLLGLELEDVDEDGSAHFRENVLETIVKVEPGSPVAVQLEFGCSIPNFGLRYTDSTGSVKAYSIMQSGMDGSLLMNEIA